VNYRHAFHAGNFADVHKHALLVDLLEYLKQKSTPLFLLDTHAGRGTYDLRESASASAGEWRTGIGRLLAPDVTPPGTALARYVAALRAAGVSSDAASPIVYPGSPVLARSVMRPGDRAVFVELHPDDAVVLRELMRGRPSTSVTRMDGYASLKAQLPPRERRGLVLIDPPYESASEYADLAAALELGLRRWPTGIFACWYPLKKASGARAMLDRIAASGVRRVLRCEFCVRPIDSAPGLAGSGMLVANPPWRFDERAREIQAELLARLPTGPGASAGVEWLIE
jgi:23S rRNA (adenine2030-N6)-methyltransferase